MTLATITLGIDPTIQVGPLQLAWRGIMTAIGLAIAVPIGLPNRASPARSHAARCGRDPDVVLRLAVIAPTTRKATLRICQPLGKLSLHH
jgi:hypothetical protein